MQKQGTVRKGFSWKKMLKLILKKELAFPWKKDMTCVKAGRQGKVWP